MSHDQRSNNKIIVVAQLLQYQQIRKELYFDHLLNIPYNLLMKLLRIILAALLACLALGQTCQVPSTITTTSTIDSLFDEAINTIQVNNSLFGYLGDPSFANLKSYVSTQGRFFIPLWTIGGLTLLCFTICAIQMCCFNCCNRKSCGTKISRKSYRPCFVTCCIYSYMILSWVLLAFVIASFILAADLIQTTQYTVCSVNQTFTELFQGTAPGVSPSWAGADNFFTFALQISTNFPNTLADLTTRFTSTEYQTTVSTTTGSVYDLASSAYNCPTTLTTSTVSCPYANFFQCAGGSATQTPIFSKQFCNTSFTNSTANLVLSEQNANSTTWRDSIFNLNSQILSFATAPADFTTLMTESQQLQDAITQYKPQLADAIKTANDNVYYAEIGIYTFLSFFTLMGLVSFITIFLIYCAKRFSCRYMLYVMWGFYGVLAITFFVASGFLVIGTLTAYDGCTAFKEVTTNQASLQSLAAYSNQLVQTMETCYFPIVGSTATDTVFQTFSQQSTYTTLTNINTQYLTSLPSYNFTTVADTIFQRLNEYSVNPNTVELDGATTAQNPQAALDSANTYAANGGSATCNAVNDFFTYNPINCFPRLLDQTAGTASCILLRSSSTTTVNNRQSAFTTNNCAPNFAVYQSNFNALNTFGSDVNSLVTNYLNDANLATYKASYFNFYSTVADFMNNQTQQLFLSYLTPFTTLIDGSQCSFLTSKLDTLVATACNSNFPYVYVLTVMCICISILFFFLMVFSYYLTTRMEFFQYIQGNFNNYDEYARDEDMIAIQMADVAYQKQHQRLLGNTAPTINTRYDPTLYDQKYHTNNNRYDGRFDPDDPRYKQITNQPNFSTPPPERSPNQ